VWPALHHVAVNQALKLNERAWRLCQQLNDVASELRVERRAIAGVNCWDFGIDAEGGLEAGLQLARVCLSDLARVALVATPGTPGTGLSVQVATDHPINACLASQYAGWRIGGDSYFAMGSGPMRAAAAVEELFRSIASESADVAVGVLETRAWPTTEVVQGLAEQCGVPVERLCLLVAPTASQAGTLQIVARSVETTIHKLMELRFDLRRIVSGAGVAPLPPVAVDDITGIGWTNDAILYGAQVTLWIRGDDESLSQVVERIPSCHSRDYGQPFAQVFARYQHDFYRIDPHLFSPAEVCLVNLDSGRTFRAGDVNRDVLAESFLA
jgi:methenyltetrahydromethanopterin cyclohydrolase